MSCVVAQHDNHISQLGISFRQLGKFSILIGCNYVKLGSISLLFLSCFDKISSSGPNVDNKTGRNMSACAIATDTNTRNDIKITQKI